MAYDLAWILDHEDSYKYQMLSRMQMDCEYYLGYSYRSPKRLWAGNEVDQIAYMKAIWKSFPKGGKPKWLRWKDILAYESLMIGGAANG